VPTKKTAPIAIWLKFVKAFKSDIYISLHAIGPDDMYCYLSIDISLDRALLLILSGSFKRDLFQIGVSWRLDQRRIASERATIHCRAAQRQLHNHATYHQRYSFQRVSFSVDLCARQCGRV
jgi:hypothetical protein